MSVYRSLTVVTMDCDCTHMIVTLSSSLGKRLAFEMIPNDTPRTTGTVLQNFAWWIKAGKTNTTCTRISPFNYCSTWVGRWECAGNWQGGKVVNLRRVNLLAYDFCNYDKNNFCYKELRTSDSIHLRSIKWRNGDEKMLRQRYLDSENCANGNWSSLWTSN